MYRNSHKKLINQSYDTTDVINIISDFKQNEKNYKKHVKDIDLFYQRKQERRDQERRDRIMAKRQLKEKMERKAKKEQKEKEDLMQFSEFMTLKKIDSQSLSSIKENEN